MSHDIFISYSRKNLDIVKPIKEELEKAGFSCWMDLSDIPSGAGRFISRVVPAIRDTRVCFLFFLTADSQGSEWAMKEIGFAQNRAKKHVVLIRINDDEMTDEFYFNYQLADIIDWRRPEQKTKLLRDLWKWTGKPERKPENDRSPAKNPEDQGGGSRTGGQVWSVRLVEVPLRRRMDVIRAIREIAGVDHQEANAWCERLGELVAGASDEEAHTIAKRLEDAGAVFKLVPRDGGRGSEETWHWAGETKTVALPGGATMEMVWCPPGTFMMGSPPEEEGREIGERQHLVKLTKGFWMARTPVTQSQWKSVMGNNPASYKGDALPVDMLKWTDCRDFCRAAGLELPTEAEWEYACRAGSTGAYGGTGRLDDMGWYGRTGGHLHPIGQKNPNAWGLYDMHGNVSEWCADRYQEDLGSSAVEDPTGAPTGTARVLRGGSWAHDAKDCRAAARGRFSAVRGLGGFGFRPVLRQGTSLVAGEGVGANAKPFP